MIGYVDNKEVAVRELKTAYSTQIRSEGEQPLLHQEVTTVQQTTQPYFEVRANNPLNSTHSISFPSSLPEPAATPAGSSATSSAGIIDPAAPAAPAAPATSRFEKELKAWWLPCLGRAREFCKFIDSVESTIPQSILDQSPTEVKPDLKKLFNEVPLVARPEFAKHFSEVVSPCTTQIAYAFPKEDTFTEIMKFLKHINSNTIVEVGCGSGFWLKLMQNAGLSCQGHELKSMREKWAFPECYIDDQYITYHIDENDQEYLKEAGAAGKTLFLCYPESEDMHKNMVAYNSAKVYLDACKNAGKTASIIYIGGYYDRDHSVTAGKKFEELLHSAFKQFGNKILLYAPRERAPDSYIHFYVARSF